MKSSALLVLLAVAAPITAQAIGFRIVDQDPFATSRGEAFTATADNPSAIYYNPAGIAALEGIQARLGVYAISLHTDFTASGSGRSFESDDSIQPVPQFYATWKPKRFQAATFGLGAYAPYGLGVEYHDDDVPFRTIAKEGQIRYFTLNPVVAFQVTRTLSLAVGMTLNKADVRLERGLFLPGDRFRFEGDGEAIGFNAGVLWQPTPQHSFGLRYHSATSVDFEGRSSVRTQKFTVPTPFGPFKVPGEKFEEDAHADLDFPQFITAGYSFRPTKDWNLEVNVDWADWDQVETATLRGGSRTGNAGIPFNYTSSFMYSAGVTRYFGHGLHASLGYIFSENSVPESQFNPVNPDSDRHVFSVGLGQHTERWQWDLAYQLARGVERHIEQGTGADGDYRSVGHAVTLSVGLHF